jgi:parallel beta-helix repeat protein
MITVRAGISLVLCLAAGAIFTAYRRPARHLDGQKSVPVRESGEEQVPRPRIDRYVSPEGDDSSDGSRAHSWRTLQKAAEMVKPGFTVHVAPGLYVYDEDLKTTVSGTRTAMIRYVSDVDRQALLRCTKTGNSAVWWNQGDYVEIEGFDISGSGALGIYNQGSHTRIIGNTVHNIPAPGCPHEGGAGISSGNYAGSDDDIIGNTVHDIGDWQVACPRVHGIYHSNLGGHIENNVVFRNQGWGIHLWHAASSVTISGNRVADNGYGGILVGSVASDFPAGAGTNDRTLVSNNLVVRNGIASGAGGYGIEEYGDVGKNNRYQNNVVRMNRPGDWNLKDTTIASRILRMVGIGAERKP